jgi:hypothetical protein
VAYAELEEVRALLVPGDLLAQGEHRIEFGDHYRDLGPNANNNGGDPAGGIQLLRVRNDESFSGFAKFEIVFSSPSAFTAYVKPVGNNVLTPIDSGTIGAQFVALNPFVPPSIAPTMFVIETEDWSGTPVADDKITWKTGSSVSVELGRKLVSRAEVQIDLWLFETGLFGSHTSLTTRIYEGQTVPEEVVMGTEHLSIFLIASRAVRGSKLADSPYFQEFQLAKNAIALFVRGRIPPPGPLVLSRKPFFPTSEDDTEMGLALFGLDTDGIEYQIAEVVARAKAYEVGLNHIGLST